VGTLRVKAVSAFSPWVSDAVVTGHDREEIGLLLFPTPAAKALAPETLHEHLHGALKAMASHSHGSAQRVTGVLVLAEPPSVDAGEITDKGYLNQRAVLARRADAVAALYGEGPMPAGCLRVMLQSA
jgi:feruloyl-CoA synthase